MKTDRYGVPLVMFGVHSEDFFPLLGRLVATSAVIERDVRLLASRVATRPEKARQSSSVRSVIELTREGVGTIGDARARADVIVYLDDAAAAFEKRNLYVHSLWPAVSHEHRGPHGWKPDPWPDELRLDPELSGLRADVKEFAEIAMRWHYKVIHVFNQLPASAGAEG